MAGSSSLGEQLLSKMQSDREVIQDFVPFGQQQRAGEIKGGILHFPWLFLTKPRIPETSMNNAHLPNRTPNRLVRFFDPETLDELPLDLDADGRFAWTAREKDVEIDLQYNRARCCDPRPGWWLGPNGPIPAGQEPASS